MNKFLDPNGVPWNQYVPPKPIENYRWDYTEAEMSPEEEETFNAMGGEAAYLDYTPDLGGIYADREINETFLRYRRLYLLHKKEKMDKLDYRLTESEAKELRRLGQDVNDNYTPIKLSDDPEENTRLLKIRGKTYTLLNAIYYFKPLDKLAW